MSRPCALAGGCSVRTVARIQGWQRRRQTIGRSGTWSECSLLYICTRWCRTTGLSRPSSYCSDARLSAIEVAGECVQPSVEGPTPCCGCCACCAFRTPTWCNSGVCTPAWDRATRPRKFVPTETPEGWPGVSIVADEMARGACMRCKGLWFCGFRNILCAVRMC